MVIDNIDTGTPPKRGYSSKIDTTMGIFACVAKSFALATYQFLTVAVTRQQFLNFKVAIADIFLVLQAKNGSPRRVSMQCSDLNVWWMVSGERIRVNQRWVWGVIPP